MPVRITGEIAPGDGMLNQQLVQIPVEAEATNIPQGIDVDVEGMEIGQAVHASDLKLPPGVTLQVEPETLVLAVIARTTAEQPEERPKRQRRGAGGAGLRRRPTAKGSRPADRGTLDHRRPRQPGAGVRGQQAQRGAHGDGPARRAGSAGARFKAHRSGNDIAEGRLAEVPVTLARPRSYMNLSGGPVAALAAFYKIPPERLVVIHDELDIPFGELRLKLGGGDNGHNGLRSITQALGTRDYYRVRFGIGRPPGRMDAAVYVLRDFSAGRAQGPAAVHRPRRRRHRDADHQGPGRGPEHLPRRLGPRSCRDDRRHAPATITRSPATWPKQAGRRLLELRAHGGEPDVLRKAGDRLSHEFLTAELAARRPGDVVLSEEGADDPARLTARRVWIVDPLDGTREFGEPGRTDWAVHVALWERSGPAARRPAPRARRPALRDLPRRGRAPRPTGHEVAVHARSAVVRSGAGPRDWHVRG